MFLSLPFWENGLPYKEAGAGVGFIRRGGSRLSWYKSRHIMPIIDMLGAATILKSEKHDIKVYDSQFSRTKNFKDLFNQLRSYERPEIAFIRTSLPTINNDIRIVKRLKEKWHDTLFAVFGPCFYSSYVIDYVKFHKIFDIIISSEIESVISKVYQSKLKTDAPGVYVKRGDDYFTADPQRLLCDLEKIPPLDYSLVNYSKLDIFVLQTSKGCPVACKFCPYYLAQGARFRVKSLDNVMTEIKFLKDSFKAKKILFRDPNFSFSRDRLHEFCESVLRDGLTLEWHCETDLARLNEKDLELMARSGCSRIAFGVESANSVLVVKEMQGKPAQVDILKKNIERCRALNIKTRAMYMLGIKGEKFEEIMNTIRLSLSLKADISAFALPGFYPDSNLFNDALAIGRIPRIEQMDKVIAYFETISNESKPPLVYAEGLTAEDLGMLRDLAIYTNLTAVSRGASRFKKAVRKWLIKRELSRRFSYPINI